MSEVETNQESLAVQEPEETNLTTGLDDYRIKPNVIELMQANHTGKYEVVVVGAFRDKVKGEQFLTPDGKAKSLRIIPLHRQMQKLYFPPGTEFGSTPLCRSIDGLFPIMGKLAERFKLVPQCLTGCANCDKGSWQGYHDQRSPRYGVPPECKDRPRLLFVMQDSELPYLLTFNGKSIKPFNDIVDSIKRDIKAETNIHRNEPNYTPYDFYDYVISLTSEKRPGKQGNYQIVRFFDLKKVEVRGTYKHLYDEYVIRPYKMYATQTAELENSPESALEGELVQEM